MTRPHKPAPGHAPVQSLVLSALTNRLRTTREIADATGLTPDQAKNALGYLRRKGRVLRVMGTWACFWALPDADATIEPIYLNDDDWTPQPWVHPIRARALGLRRTV